MPTSRHIARRLTLLRAAPPLAAMLAAAVLLGCGGSGTPRGGAPASSSPVATVPTAAHPATPGTPTRPDTATRAVTVYFADADAQHVVPETRRVPASSSPLRAALVELARGPRDPAHLPALPAGTQVVGTDVRGGEALVNLSREFLRGYPPGGAAAEFAVLAPLVYTATAVPGVDRVRITVDGLTPSPTGSQYDWRGAFTRADFPGARAGTR